MASLPFALTESLPDSSTFYGALIAFGFLLGIYAHAARMPRLVGFAILFVFVATILTLLAARSFQGQPPDQLP